MLLSTITVMNNMINYCNTTVLQQIKDTSFNISSRYVARNIKIDSNELSLKHKTHNIHS